MEIDELSAILITNHDQSIYLFCTLILSEDTLVERSLLGFSIGHRLQSCAQNRESNVAYNNIIIIKSYHFILTKIGY